MSCKCNNGTASAFGASFGGRNRKNYSCCGESTNDTCGREMASSCQAFDGVPTRVYNSCGCTSCIFPSFTTGNGCSGNSSCCSCSCNANTSRNSCGCSGNSSCSSCNCNVNTSRNSCGCSGNSSCGSCSCNANTSRNSCGCSGNSSCGSCNCNANTSFNSCGCGGNGCNGGCASNGSCGSCGGSSYGVYLPIVPVGLPFWYGGYYNGGCNCCQNSVDCDSVSDVENKNVSSVQSPKRTAINK